jgi:hypothetical protein
MSSFVPVSLPCWWCHCLVLIRRKQPGEFPKSTIDLLQTFAAQAVAAIQNAPAVDQKGSAYR